MRHGDAYRRKGSVFYAAAGEKALDAASIQPAAMACMACGNMEATVFFGCCGGFAATTTEIHNFFRPAGDPERWLRSLLRKSCKLQQL
jgi:hypothetical protein